MTIDQKIAQEIKRLMQAPNSEESIKTIGNTHIQKIDGVIAVFINGKLIFSFQQDSDCQYSEVWLTSAMAIKRMNALAEAMQWEFDLYWQNGKPSYEANGAMIELSTDKGYSIFELRETGYC